MQRDLNYFSCSSCISYEWNGMIYENSGTYEFDTLASNGCDSTAVLELEICYLDQLEIYGPAAARVNHNICTTENCFRP